MNMISPDNGVSKRSAQKLILNEKELQVKDVCKLSLCDCETKEEDLKQIPERFNTLKRVTIDDLIELGTYYHCRHRTHFKTLDLAKIAHIHEALKELNEMEGIVDVKQKIVDISLYLIKNKDIKGKNYNLAIYGPPGVGKTTICKHVAKIYSKLGVLETENIVIVKRSDLVGKYLGETAIKTQDVINKCKGGILFIDEVYSLGHPEGRDSYSKECLDTLTANLGQSDTNFICMVAGYEEDVEKCFFSHNKGLKRRFPFTFTIDDYENHVMANVVHKKLEEGRWNVEESDKETITSFIKDHQSKFENFMGDVENFLLKLEICHNAENVFGGDEKKLTRGLLNRAIKQYYDNGKKEKQPENDYWKRMYM